MKIVISIIKKIFSPYILLVVSFVILVIGRYIFKQKYLNCFEIIQKHLKCFKKSNGKISKFSILMYFIVPFFMAIALLQIRNIDDEVINILTVITSILTSMFFTLLTLILDMRSKVKNNPAYNAGDASISLQLLKETYYAIMFEILVSIIILIMCFIELFAKQFYKLWGLALYYFSFVMLTNLFMILKRIYKVINKDLENT